jgi:hypothetical protein
MAVRFARLSVGAVARRAAALTFAATRGRRATAAIVTTADNRQFRTDDAGKTWMPVAP